MNIERRLHPPDGVSATGRPWVSVQDRRTRIALAGLGFLLAGLCSFAAYSLERPVTAALIFVFGVTVIGAMVGIWGGFAAGVLASLVYTFVVSGRPSYISIDDLVPLVAFNFSAIGSGLVAGLLRDRARTAEQSRSRMQALFEMSQSLQGVLNESEIIATASPFLASGPASSVEIYLHDGRELVAHSPGVRLPSLAEELWKSGAQQLVRDDCAAFVLGSSAERIGVLAAQIGRGSGIDDLKGFATVVGIALERAILSRRLGEADVLRRSEEFKTALLSSVSHDIRTPLSAIAASATSLSRFDDTLDKATKLDLLATIKEQCERLDRLTSNLLSLGRIQGGLDVRTMPVVDAIEILGRVLARIRTLGSAHKIEKEIDVSSALVRSEAVMLEQIFYNILENALVHTEPGTTILTSVAVDDRSVRIAVEDSGFGIPESEMERVFERFAQVSRKRTSRGAGLGLSIVKGFAEAIGGEVHGSRARWPLRGTRIEVVLPSAAEQVQ